RILTTYDPILGGQAKALVEFATQMAATDQFTDTERHALRTSAWLCDLGLIGMPREMLRAFRGKPEQLTERERAMLHNHPVYGQTLAALVDARSDVGECIRAHHERFDGRGYPDGLAGDSIPWTARCLAVAVGFVESGLTRPPPSTISSRSPAPFTIRRRCDSSSRSAISCNSPSRCARFCCTSSRPAWCSPTASTVRTACC